MYSTNFWISSLKVPPSSLSSFICICMQHKMLRLQKIIKIKIQIKVKKLIKNIRHHHQEQNANRTISFRQDSKEANEMVWTPPSNGK